MKFIEKVTLIIYSNLILIASIIVILSIFGWINLEVVLNVIKNLMMDDTSSKVLLGSSIVCILLSIRCIFFDPVARKEQREKQGVLLANENGKLMISKETIENIVETVTNEQKVAKDVSSSVELDKENNLTIFINIAVPSDTVIKDLSSELQNKVKDKIKQTVDLEVKSVNIKVKKAIPEKTKKGE